MQSSFTLGGSCKWFFFFYILNSVKCIQKESYWIFFFKETQFTAYIFNQSVYFNEGNHHFIEIINLKIQLLLFLFKLNSTLNTWYTTYVQKDMDVYLHRAWNIFQSILKVDFAKLGHLCDLCFIISSNDHYFRVFNHDFKQLVHLFCVVKNKLCCIFVCVFSFCFFHVPMLFFLLM